MIREYTRLYDNTSMSNNVLTVLLVWRSIALLAFNGALFSSKKLLKQENNQEKNENPTSISQI
jgi:hypothetical protein